MISSGLVLTLLIPALNVVVATIQAIIAIPTSGLPAYDAIGAMFLFVYVVLVWLAGTCWGLAQSLRARHRRILDPAPLP